MGKISPLFNKCLIQIDDEYADVIRPDDDAGVQKGTLIEATLMGDHLTTSTGYHIEGLDQYGERLKDLVGKTVFWEQYGEAGNIIKQDGKQYALVPFYRLIAVED